MENNNNRYIHFKEKEDQDPNKVSIFQNYLFHIYLDNTSKQYKQQYKK